MAANEWNKINEQRGSISLESERVCDFQKERKKREFFNSSRPFRCCRKYLFFVVLVIEYTQVSNESIRMHGVWVFAPWIYRSIFPVYFQSAVYCCCCLAWIVYHSSHRHYPRKCICRALNFHFKLMKWRHTPLSHHSHQSSHTNWLNDLIHAYQQNNQ